MTVHIRSAVRAPIFSSSPILSGLLPQSWKPNAHIHKTGILFEALVPCGCENDAGGFGDLVLDVRKRKITVERNDRFEDYSTTTYEV